MEGFSACCTGSTTPAGSKTVSKGSLQIDSVQKDRMSKILSSKFLKFNSNFENDKN